MPASASLIIRSAQPEDSAEIASIYNHHIAHSIATFEEHALDVEAMRARQDKVRSAGFEWLVAQERGAVVGYAYAAPWNVRSAYRYSVETTVYLAAGAESKGIGSKLYDVLFPQLIAGGYRVAMAGISLPNAPSVALHEKFGMHKVAHFSEVGYKFDRWIDVGYWQRTLSTEGT